MLVSFMQCAQNLDLWMYVYINIIKWYLWIYIYICDRIPSTSYLYNISKLINYNWLNNIKWYLYISDITPYLYITKKIQIFVFAYLLLTFSYIYRNFLIILNQNKHIIQSQKWKVVSSLSQYLFSSLFSWVQAVSFHSNYIYFCIRVVITIILH